MGYKNEKASKTSHVDIIKNSDVQVFLENCQLMTPPSDIEGERIARMFISVPNFSEIDIPRYILATDGSSYEASIDDRFPSTRIIYLKFSCLLIDTQKLSNLWAYNRKFIDPFKFAEIQKDNASISLVLPSSNVIKKGYSSVCDSFRAALDKQLYEIRSDNTKPETSLRSTLFALAALRSGPLKTGEPQSILLHTCPSCKQGPVEVRDIPDEQSCPYCNKHVYPSDCLRVWEEVHEYQSNTVAITRLMQQMEHLLTFHYIRILRELSLNALSAVTFIIDGPLAIYGNGAWLHAVMLKYLHKVNNELKDRGLPEVLVIGLQKSGQIYEHLNLIDKYVPNESLLPVSDDYRYNYITPSRERSSNGFGYETYYGQDFIYKTSSGKMFVFALPYYCAEKNVPDKDTFLRNKININNYPGLPKALKIIKNFETELYENALIPVALAHKYTAISLQPGGKVLDLLTKNFVSNQQR